MCFNSINIVFSMIFFLPLVIIILSILWAYLKWRKVKNYWADRKIPHLPPNPIFGSLTFLMKENTGIWLRRMNDHFKSPYIGVWLFWRPCLLVHSPEIAKNILVRDFMNFRDRYMSSGETDPLGGLNLLTMNDPLWTPIRRSLSSIFTAAKLRCLQNYIQSKSNELVERIQNEGNYIKDLKELYTDYTTDSIGTSAFGVESNATLTGKGPLRDVTKDFSKYSLFRSISWSSIFFFPELVDFFRFKFYPAPSEAYFRKIYHHIEAQRKADKERNTQDLLDLLLKIKTESKINGEAGYSDDLILAQAAIFLFGGYETTGTLLTFATYALAYQPEIQEKLYKELIEAKEKNGSGMEFEAQTLAELPYLNAVLKETLRKFTTMGWLDRIASSDYQVDDSLSIKAGTVVYINTIGMHYNPQYFPDPYKFNPDRFMPENADNICPYSYMPFGEGPRSCVGKRFGYMTARYGISSIILNYKIHPVPGAPKPDDIKIDTRGAFYLPGENAPAKFIPRK